MTLARLNPVMLAATLVIGGLAAALPWLGASRYQLVLVYYFAYYLALGQAWNLMSGMTGYVSFAHGALAGIGAYATVMAMNAGVPMGLAILIGAAAAGVSSLVIGATSLRLRGIAFTFATLFFQALALLIVRKLPATGGAGGLPLQDILPIWLPQLFMILLAVFSTILMMVLRTSRTGTRLLAIKGDEAAALSLGIASARLKLLFFCISAVLAGLAGAFHGLFTASLYPDVVFSFDTSITALAVPLIGGVATAFGPAAGAILFVGVGELLDIFAPGLHNVVIGALLVAVVLFMPSGLVPFIGQRLRPQRNDERPPATSREFAR
jgi:branched-chain amino acid transport system permease protein